MNEKSYQFVTDGRTDGPTLIIESFAFKNTCFYEIYLKHVYNNFYAQYFLIRESLVVCPSEIVMVSKPDKLAFIIIFLSFCLSMIDSV